MSKHEKLRAPNRLKDLIRLLFLTSLAPITASNPALAEEAANSGTTSAETVKPGSDSSESSDPYEGLSECRRKIHELGPGKGHEGGDLYYLPGVNGKKGCWTRFTKG